MKKAAILLCLSVIFFIGMWLIVIPEGVVLNLLEDATGRDDLYFEIKDFKKGLFCNFTAESIFLKKRNQGTSDDTILIVDEVNVSLNILSLFKLRPALVFDCKMNAGKIAGTIRLTGQGTVTASGSGISTSALPFLDLIGMKGDGNLEWSLHLNNGRGEARFSVDNAKINWDSSGGFLIPLSVFKDIRGDMVMNDGTMELRSIVLEGSGVYARAKGSIMKGRMAMNLELMMDSSFDVGEFDPTMIERYKVSPGYYVIPINTSLFRKAVT